MHLLADSSAWSQAMRRDDPQRDAVGATLLEGLRGRHTIIVTGVVLQEVLQGRRGPQRRPELIEQFRYLSSIAPSLDDHVAAADLRNHCRTNGVQVSTVDALLASLCIRHKLTMLTTDQDFDHIAQLTPLEVWQPAA